MIAYDYNLEILIDLICFTLFNININNDAVKGIFLYWLPVLFYVTLFVYFKTIIIYVTYMYQTRILFKTWTSMVAITFKNDSVLKQAKE